MILGLDVATRCGFAYGDGSAVPMTGHYQGEGAGDDLAPYFRAFRNWIHGLLIRLKKAAEEDGQTLRVIFEAPVFPKPFLKWAQGRPIIVQHASIVDRRRLYGLVSIVEMTCGDLGIACYESSPGALKKELTGRGDADKDDMVRAALKMGCRISQLPQGGYIHDEADAVAAWLVGVRHYAKKHREHWDRVLYSARGAML